MKKINREKGYCKFLSFFCLSIPKRDLDTKKTTPNIEVWPESLGAMLEYWYIERGLLDTYVIFTSITRALKAHLSISLLSCTVATQV